jgi:hypothetical protein
VAVTSGPSSRDDRLQKGAAVLDGTVGVPEGNTAGVVVPGNGVAVPDDVTANHGEIPLLRSIRRGILLKLGEDAPHELGILEDRSYRRWYVDGHKFLHFPRQRVENDPSFRGVLHRRSHLKTGHRTKEEDCRRDHAGQYRSHQYQTSMSNDDGDEINEADRVILKLGLVRGLRRSGGRSGCIGCSHVPSGRYNTTKLGRRGSLVCGRAGRSLHAAPGCLDFGHLLRLLPDAADVLKHES